MRYCILFITLLISLASGAQMVHWTAHAHNDYEHSRPLLDALGNGFRSVEVDIHLVGGELYVSHSKPRPSASITLEALYLKPLDSLCKLHLRTANDVNLPLILLVDIKTDATATMNALVRIMDRYPVLFSSEASGPLVKVVISGNRDYPLILKTDRVFMDGRPGDLGKGYSMDKMPLISDHFGNWMHWNGKGTPESVEIQQVRDLANRVHGENKKLRLWAIPDREEAWRVLLEAGVDFINTDRLEALNEFLIRRASERKKSPE